MTDREQDVQDLMNMIGKRRIMRCRTPGCDRFILGTEKGDCPHCNDRSVDMGLGRVLFVMPMGRRIFVDVLTSKLVKVGLVFSSLQVERRSGVRVTVKAARLGAPSVEVQAIANPVEGELWTESLLHELASDLTARGGNEGAF